MTDAASGVRWTVGERVFVDDDEWQICVESNCTAIRSRVRRARSDQATMTTTIQGY